MMKKLVLLFFLSFLFCGFCKAQDFSRYKKNWLVQGSDTLPYRLLLPENYDPLKKYPLLFFLHGAGERGNNNQAQLTHGATLFLKESVRKQFPAIVIFPQCSNVGYWSQVARLYDSTSLIAFHFPAAGPPTKDMELLSLLLQYMMETYPVKINQVYVGGLSMGGMGTFELVRRNPGVFAAAFPICGGANPLIAKEIKKTKWWVFHGAKDDVVPPVFSQKMVDALIKQKGSVKFNLYPEANHNSWDAAFAEPDLLPWLFAQHK